MAFELEYFKPNDEKEQRVVDCALPSLQVIESALDEFLDGAFEAAPLGQVLWDLDKAPLTTSISREAFAASFFEIFKYFTKPGTFEYYLDVFRAIWGDSVEVEFVVPAAGKLEINIDALDAQAFNFAFRRITDNEYFYDDFITVPDSDEVMAQGTQGLKTQEEAEKFIIELYPAGIYLTITLTIG